VDGPHRCSLNLASYASQQSRRGKEKAGGSALAPHTIVGAVEPECEQEEATSSPQILVSKGATRSERAIITPAPYRTLILVKVPCSIVLVSGEIAKRAASDWPTAR